MVTKAAVCCPNREQWGKNGHQSGRLLPGQRALGVKTVIKEAVCCPARERWGENGHQSGRLLPGSRALG
ncbi:hypothetical protein [Falsibacillus albus]|uniref:hypothetical protein n=1 Tax=Falsibacillus albus TaxID=2478915 RepID=UPI0011E5A4EF|nr:hypothetical protein [Falsibacillus albus]